MSVSKIKGVTLSEYSIILAIIAGVVVIAFLALGQNIVGVLTSFSDVMVENNDKTQINNIQTPSQVGEKVGPLGGTSDNPVKQCTNNICTIDFGEFVLNGLPENFNSFVEKGGASGGTDKLSDLIMQLAQQAESDNKTELATQLRELAQLGHNLAVMQKYCEESVNICSGDSTCMENEIRNKNMVIPAGYDKSVAPFPKASTYADLDLIFDIGYARNYKNTNPDEYSANVASKNLSYLFVDQYDSITRNKEITDATKGVLQELFWDVGTINEDFDTSLCQLFGGGDGGTHFDPITGEESPTGTSPDPYGDFASYKASKITHFDSALICGAGQNSDSGTECH